MAKTADGSRRNFYPRPPRGGRPDIIQDYVLEGKFLSTPSARRATDAPLLLQYGVGISIHALREEGDLCRERSMDGGDHFYPRPPRGGRPRTATKRASSGRFLSTPSARRATEVDKYPGASKKISIHALREEGDEPFIVQITASSLFLSTPSARRATKDGTMTIMASKFLSTPSARRATRLGPDV